MIRRETLIAWLNDAYAMETALVPVLENHAKDAKHLPEVEARDRRHVEETRRHAELVRQCLERLGETPSSAKTALGSLLGGMQAPATGMFEDEVVKNFLTDYATEHFEIASYTALIAAAREADQPEIVAACEQILREEEDMADWIRDRLPGIVQGYARSKASADAK